MPPASLLKRFFACLYEALALVAIWLLCTFIFIRLFGSATTPFKQLSLQLLLWALTGAYFVVCWITTGQTLAMQAWKIKLVNAEGGCLSIQPALLRYALVTVSAACFGAGFLWALIDKEHLFLHDRLLKTRLMQLAQD